MNAAPVSMWTKNSYYLMIINGLTFLAWTLNAIFGRNDGSSIHNFWLRTSEVATAAPILFFILPLVASGSYGTRAEVYTSWSGLATYSAIPVLASCNHKYLMFRD
jgi:hypothetical protein